MTNQSRVFVPVEKIADFTLKSRADDALVPSDISSFSNVEFHSDSGEQKHCKSVEWSSFYGCYSGQGEN